MTDAADWIGRKTERSDQLTARLVAELRATLAGTLGDDDVPLGAHWCLAPDVVTPDQLGPDGHPGTGIFLPALPLPRRMWAGGELRHIAPLVVGERVNRISTIADVRFKSGRSGKLGFVTVQHEIQVAGAPRIIERQDIVYRDPPEIGQPAPAPEAAPDWDVARSWTLTPTPTLLFRFSALTFNGHRIHYDHPYATGVEGYGGLVVHGPLQAVWMLNLARSLLGAAPAVFAYRGQAPLICGAAVAIEAQAVAGGCDLRVRRLEDGVVTMSATARQKEDA